MMSPHADSPDSPRSLSIDNRTNGHHSVSNGHSNGHTNGHTNGHVNGKTNGQINGYGHGHDLSSHLTPVSKDEMHDLLCVGFGPASLAIAVALHDALDSGEQLNTRRPKVAFLERQDKFAWHSGMQIPGAKMQISFVKDLATLRNPRSEFTFLNYLFKVGRLVQFTNLSTFLPRRIEYEDYMRWCAGHFDDVVSYSEEVVAVDPIKVSGGSKKIAGFSVTTRNILTKETSTRRARHVVIAAGGRPKIPDGFPQNHPRVLHSSQYKVQTPKAFPDRTKPVRVAIIGGGQSAAEIFNDVHQHFPNSKSYFLIKDTALRPSDDSPFVNEIFDPNRVDKIYTTTAERRSEMIAADKVTNYGVVRLELLEDIYEEMYAQRLEHGNDESTWPRRILTQRRVTSIVDASAALDLTITNTSDSSNPSTEHLVVDLVYVAAGYQRNIHELMLQNCRHLMPGGDEQGKKWEVGRNYAVRFEKAKVEKEAGVWLQGCNENTHGLSDTLLSILSVRGGEMVGSIFGADVPAGDETDGVVNGVDGH